VHTANPSFKSTVEMTKMNWLGTVMPSADDRGAIVHNEQAMREALELGKKAATP